MTKLFTAIIYTKEKQVNGNQFLKYRNINNQEKFLKFAAKFPGATYVNWYDKATKSYIKRDYLT